MPTLRFALRMLGISALLMGLPQTSWAGGVVGAPACVNKNTDGTVLSAVGATHHVKFKEDTSGTTYIDVLVEVTLPAGIGAGGAGKTGVFRGHLTAGTVVSPAPVVCAALEPGELVDGAGNTLRAFFGFPATKTLEITGIFSQVDFSQIPSTDSLVQFKPKPNLTTGYAVKPEMAIVRFDIVAVP